MSKISNEGRNISVDAIKGIAAFGVVVIHASGYMAETNIHVWLKAIGRFAVPVFVFLFVYFIEISLKRENKIINIIRNKLEHLVIPFSFWTCFYVLLNFLNSRVTGYSNKLIPLFDWKIWTYQGWAGQYFFVVLLESLLLLLIFRNFSSIFLVTISVISVILNVAIAYWNPISELQIYGYLPPNVWLPYVCIGILYVKFFKTLQIMPLWLRIMAILSPNLIGVELLYTVGTDEAIVYLFPSVFIASTLIALTGASYGEGAFTRLLSGVGKQSMAVFCINPLLIPVFHRLIPIDSSTLWGVIILSILVTTSAKFIGEYLTNLHLSALLVGKVKKVKNDSIGKNI